MGTITNFYDDERINDLGETQPETNLASRPLSEAEDKASKVAQATLSEIEHPSDGSLNPNRITAPPAGADAVPSPGVVKADETQGIAAPEELPSLDDVNFVVRVRELVAQLLAQLSRISENDRKQIENLKKEYRVSAHEAAEMQINMGRTGVVAAAVSFAVSLSQFLIQHPNADTMKADREMIQFLANQVPAVGNLFRDRYQSKQMDFQAVRDLRNQEIQMKNSKTQSESGTKQEILQLLTTVLQLLKGASDRN